MERVEAFDRASGLQKRNAGRAIYGLDERESESSIQNPDDIDFGASPAAEH